MSASRQGRARFKQRGVAALEFALSTVFLIPLILGTLDFGYYFWVSVNAAEAAKEAGMAATRAGAGSTDCTLMTAPQIAARNLGIAAGQARGIAYMAAAGTGLPVPTVTVTCVNVPPGSFSTVVEVNFQPVVGFVKATMPAGSPSGYVRYRTPAFVSP